MCNCRLAGITLLAVLVLFSCVNNTGKIASITSVDAVVENIDPDWWDTSSNSSLFVTFHIAYKGMPIDLATLEYVRVYKSDMAASFNIPLQEVYFDGVDKVIGRGIRFVDGDYNNALPLTDMKCIIKYDWGFSSVRVFDIPGPGESVASGIPFAYTEDYPTSGPTGSVQAIRRAVISSYDKDTSVDITFTGNDSRVYSGRVDFFDSSRDLLGRTLDFVDYETGTVASIINNSTTVHTDDSSNVVHIEESDIHFFDNSGFADIVYFSVVLTDGAQYNGTPRDYGWMSRTAKTAFP
jgi:hypothetical protein